MADLFDRANEALVALEQRTQYDARNRTALLIVHAVIGIIVGWNIFQYGPPNPWLVRFGLDTAPLLAGPAFLGGILLLLGLVWNRNIILEAIGMTLILVWDVTMVYVLTVYGSAPPYTPWVYVGMACLMGVHVVTLIRYLWTRKDRADHDHS